MSNEKKLASELLKQNGLQPGTVSEDEQRKLRQMIAKQRARVRRMKWATIISWSLLALCYVVLILISHLLGVTREDVAPYAFLSLALFWIAILCSVSWFLRSRTLGQREIQAKLADIEAQLERLQQGLSEQQQGGDSQA